MKFRKIGGKRVVVGAAKPKAKRKSAPKPKSAPPAAKPKAKRTPKPKAKRKGAARAKRATKAKPKAKVKRASEPKALPTTSASSGATKAKSSRRLHLMSLLRAGGYASGSPVWKAAIALARDAAGDVTPAALVREAEMVTGAEAKGRAEPVGCAAPKRRAAPRRAPAARHAAPAKEHPRRFTGGALLRALNELGGKATVEELHHQAESDQIADAIADLKERGLVDVTPGKTPGARTVKVR